MKKSLVNTRNVGGGGTDLSSYNAFTLAEVLITLGIIGVVAALTLPSVINVYRIKQLETAFKRTSALIESAAKDTAVYFGYDNFKDFNLSCSTLGETETAGCVTANQDFYKQISDYFYSRFKVVDRLGYYKLCNIPSKEFSGTGNLSYCNFYRGSYYYIFNDGSLMSDMSFFHHGKYDGITIPFDTNGPKKGPNRFGYDIFYYNTGTWYKLCTASGYGMGPEYNGRGCYDYALKDENPDDNTKGYWESLKW